MTLTLLLCPWHLGEQSGQAQWHSKPDLPRVVVQYSQGPVCGAGDRASVQRPPQEGAPSRFPSGLLPPVSCIRPHVSRSRTLPCPLSFLLVLIATQSITYLMVLKGPLPQAVRMEQIEGVKGTEHSGWKMLCLPPPCLLMLVRLATSMFLLFLCGKKLSYNLIQG